ncbi:MAG TPA: hypothetical protein VMW58_03135 [Anaerolineae bacterium]|nr:hypothetical protein [Anaerolineae bacterium]
MRLKHLLILLFIPVFLSSCLDGPATPEGGSQRAATPTRIPRASPTPTPPLAFETVSENAYQDPVGSLRFLVEVENANDYPVESVSATVVLRDEEGRAVASQSAYARLDLLEAGDVAPVLVVFFLAHPDFATHDLEIDAQRADYLAQLLHPALEVVDLSGRIGEWVPYEVLGQVHNAGPLDAQSVTLSVTCYDADEQIVAIGTGRPTDRVILAHGSSEFLVSLGALAGNIDKCRVRAEGLVPSGY